MTTQTAIPFLQAREIVKVTLHARADDVVIDAEDFKKGGCIAMDVDIVVSAYPSGPDHAGRATWKTRAQITFPPDALAGATGFDERLPYTLVFETKKPA